MSIKNPIRKNVICTVLSLIVILLLATPGQLYAELQDVVDSRDGTAMILYKGDLVTLKVYSLTRIAVQNPGIVDIANADVDEIVFVGQGIGETQIFIWDEYGKRSIIARVYREDLDMLQKRIEAALDALGIDTIKITKNDLERKIVLSAC